MKSVDLLAVEHRPKIPSQRYEAATATASTAAAIADGRNVQNER